MPSDSLESVYNPHTSSHGLAGVELTKLPLNALTSNQSNCNAKCGLGYKATQEHVPGNNAGRFECITCFAEVHSWSGVYDYAEWKAIKMRSRVIGRKI